MAKVELNLLNIFWLNVKKKSLEYEGKNISEIISQFIKEYKNELDGRLLSKNKKKINSNMLILVNGKDVNYLNKYKTKLKDGDKIYLSAPISGG
ncbi:MAG: MoaD/ThiS family protein [Candidatus Hermodarchaeota archaeon]